MAATLLGDAQSRQIAVRFLGEATAAWPLRATGWCCPAPLASMSPTCNWISRCSWMATRPDLTAFAAPPPPRVFLPHNAEVPAAPAPTMSKKTATEPGSAGSGGCLFSVPTQKAVQRFHALLQCGDLRLQSRNCILPFSNVILCFVQLRDAESLSSSVCSRL